jgi:hypothetical protein
VESRQWAMGSKQWSVLRNFGFLILKNLAEVLQNFDLVKNVKFHEIKILKFEILVPE